MHKSTRLLEAPTRALLSTSSSDQLPKLAPIQKHVFGFLRDATRKTAGADARLGLAISGGVDSMALASLCHQYQQYCQTQEPTVIPLFFGFIVDHGLRKGSSEEASRVAHELRRIRITPRILKLDWTAHRGTTNTEGVARRLRYQALGVACYRERLNSLLIAHHADDQAETIMYRILNEYLGNGLRGIQSDVGIPECEGIYGVDRSGRPYLPSSQMQSGQMQALYRYADNGMAIESGGVKLYRPLLPFPKDDCIQVCRDNSVTWFDDDTNTDKTFTLRNTIRHVYQEGSLPVALQRKNLNAMADRIAEDSAKGNKQVDEVFNTLPIILEPATGRVQAILPSEVIGNLQPGESGYRFKALLAQRFLALVAPTADIAPRKLARAVLAMFTTSRSVKVTVAGVIVAGDCCAGGSVRKITLHRQRPDRIDPRIIPFSTPQQRKQHDGTGEDGFWSDWLLWDRRYWIRIGYRSETAVTSNRQFFVRSLNADLLAAKMTRLGADRQEREMLEWKLRTRAPGDLRWILPVIVSRYVDGRGFKRQEMVALPSLDWSDPTAINLDEEEGDGVRLCWDIRYKAVEFGTGARHAFLDPVVRNEWEQRFWKGVAPGLTDRKGHKGYLKSLLERFFEQ